MKKSFRKSPGWIFSDRIPCTKARHRARKSSDWYHGEEKMNPKLVKPALIFGGVILVSIYFMFSSGEPENDSGDTSNSDDQALSALFGGGSGSSESGGSVGGGMEGESKSIFESGFWESGVPENVSEDMSPETEEDDNGILEPVSEGNPINPQTGTPYTDAVMKQFDSLRKKFPGNSIIPKRLSPEEKAEEDNIKNKISEIQRKLSQREASEDDINFYYDRQSKQVNDRLELLSYVLEKQGDKMSDEIQSKYKEVLAMNKKQVERNEEARKQALGRITGEIVKDTE